MASTGHYLLTEDLHPIDIVEHIAEHHAWDFDRVADDQIAMAIAGQWRTYSITLAWSPADSTLRLICTFEMEPPEDKLGKVWEMLNAANDQIWSGAFSYWNEQKLMVFRYGLILGRDQIAESEQIDRMIKAAVVSAERYYPAFQLAAWSDRTAADSIKVAIGEAYGRA